MNFENLVTAIADLHKELLSQSCKAINIALTVRNWFIGHHIEEYERKGIDRAKYGESLMAELSAELVKKGLRRCDRRELYRYRQFYLIYPQIVESLSPQLLKSSQLLAITAIKKVESPTPELRIPGKKLLEKLSFTHLAELIKIDDPTKRAFYEVECMRGNWSVRELKRQIASLYYERVGLSRDKKQLTERTQAIAEESSPALTIRDPYIFEFLGLKPKEVMGESELEDSLLDKLQDFLLELGHGFCFEARQKRILIGDEYFFVDLVFYHRVLKCHVLIELKVDGFTHEHIGQLNTYVNWFRSNEVIDGDNPPIGILLCTQKNHTLVEYALAGMDNQLFVSKYQLELPKKDDIQHFLEKHIAEETGGGV